MINIPVKTAAPLTRETIFTLNDQKRQQPFTRQTIPTLNHPKNSAKALASPVNAAPSQPTFSAKPSFLPPELLHPVQKGQKVALDTNPLTKLQAKLGWNSTNPECDVDVSAFLLDDSGKVIGDDWFVFYGQPQSPDGSTVFSDQADQDLENITIDLSRLQPSVTKIVFVLTINEAFEKHLNFSMMKDAYIRILDAVSHKELVSFPMTDYYANVISMMIGELYFYKGIWKFHAIGNGVAKDLAGLCEFYGVQVV